jgi:hypothetical protein
LQEKSGGRWSDGSEAKKSKLLTPSFLSAFIVKKYWIFVEGKNY